MRTALCTVSRFFGKNSLYTINHWKHGFSIGIYVDWNCTYEAISEATPFWKKELPEDVEKKDIQMVAFFHTELTPMESAVLLSLDAEFVLKCSLYISIPIIHKPKKKINPPFECPFFLKIASFILPPNHYNWFIYI